MPILKKREILDILDKAPTNAEKYRIYESLLKRGYEMEGEFAFLPGPKGDKGDRGDKGERGAIGPQGQMGMQGIPGKDGRDGRDGRDGTDGKDGKDGKDGSPDTAEDIRNKLELLSDEERLDAKYIKNLPESVQRTIVERGGFVETPLKAGTNVTVTKDASGAWVIGAPATSGGFVNTETPTGTVNGSNTTFTFTVTPKVIVVDTGRIMISGLGFTMAGLVATLDVAPVENIFSIY